MNKFGRSLSNRRHVSMEINRPQHILPLTDDGNFDVGNHTLCNLNMPVNQHDAASKDYVDNISNQIHTGMDVINRFMPQMASKMYVGVIQETIEKNINSLKRDRVKLKKDVLSIVKTELSRAEERLNAVIAESLSLIKTDLHANRQEATASINKGSSQNKT